MTRFGALGFLGLALGGGSLSAQVIAYEGGLSASTGKYFFTERTTSFSLSTGFSVRSGRVTLRATLPVWWQNTSLITATGAGPVPGGGPYGREAVRDSGEARQQRKGMGGGGNGTGQGGGPAGSVARLVSATRPSVDATAEPDVPAPNQALRGYEVALADPTVQASMRLISGTRVTLSASLSAKVPVADTTSIGTGEWDVGAATALTYGISPRVTLGIDGSWWHLGDMPDFNFRNPVMGSASIGALVGDQWGVLASFSAGSSALEGYDPPIWAGGALTRFGDRGSVGLSLTVGFTETVPDLGVGLVWTLRLR